MEPQGLLCYRGRHVFCYRVFPSGWPAMKLQRVLSVITSQRFLLILTAVGVWVLIGLNVLDDGRQKCTVDLEGILIPIDDELESPIILNGSAECERVNK